MSIFPDRILELEAKVVELEKQIEVHQRHSEACGCKNAANECDIQRLNCKLKKLLAGQVGLHHAFEFQFPDAEEYVNDYEMDCDEGIYHPTEHERFLIADALMGYIADLPKHYETPQPRKPLNKGEILDAKDNVEHVAWNDGRADSIVTQLYVRFKEWSKRGFSADDVTWCEVKNEINQLITLYITEQTNIVSANTPQECEHFKAWMAREMPAQRIFWQSKKYAELVHKRFIARVAPHLKTCGRCDGEGEINGLITIEDGYQTDVCGGCNGAGATPEANIEPEAYVRTVIDALHENGDPVSIEAAELIEKLNAVQVNSEPDLFWDNDDPEQSCDSINDVVVQVYENSGCLLVGDIVEIQRAVRLPNIKVKITKISDDGDLEWEQTNETSRDSQC